MGRRGGGKPISQLVSGAARGAAAPGTAPRAGPPRSTARRSHRAPAVLPARAADANVAAACTLLQPRGAVPARVPQACDGRVMTALKQLRTGEGGDMPVPPWASITPRQRGAQLSATSWAWAGRSPQWDATDQRRKVGGSGPSWRWERGMGVTPAAHLYPAVPVHPPPLHASTSPLRRWHTSAAGGLRRLAAMVGSD